MRGFTFLWPLVAWAAYSWFQSYPLSPALVSVLSPGSYAAYVDWVTPILPADLRPSSFPLSVAPESTKHSAAMLTLLIPIAYSVAIACRERTNVLVLLGVITIGIAGHSMVGMVFTEVPLLETLDEFETASSTSFGTFFNRNNTALLLNLGLSCGLGLIAHRLATFRTDDINHRSPQSGNWTMMFHHSDMLIGMASVGICATGLLACGSRGGVVGAFLAGLVAFGWLRSRRGFVAIPAIGLVFVVLVALAISTFPNVFTTFRRFQDIDLKSGAGTNDARLEHWPDGARAAAGYFPAGSGLGTYAHAYLPYQETSPGYWFHHADNLWLELSAEQGVPGILLAAWIIGMLVLAVSRLSHSADPIDKGLGTCGWYLIAATIVTQMFDFGLIVPGNLFTFTVLASAIIVRGCRPALKATSGGRHAIQDDARSAGVLFSSGSFRLSRRTLPAAFGLLIVFFGAACLPRLKSDAKDDTLVRSAELELARERVDPRAVERILDSIQSATVAHSSPEILLVSAQIYSWIGRLQTVTAQDLDTVEDVQMAFDRARRIEQRRRWYRQSSALTMPAEAYLAAVQSSQLALTKLPLGIEPRMQLAYLDFAHQDAGRSQIAVTQLGMLQSQSAKQLAVLAVLAGDAGDFESSAKYWRNATELNVRLTRNALLHAERTSGLNLTDIISSTPQSLRAASRYLLEHEFESPAMKAQIDGFLEHAIAKVDCDRCETIRETAVCEELLGDMHFQLNQLDDCFVHYEKALQLTPSNRRLRAKLVKKLAANNRAEEAARLRGR
ncbi:O-Antigen ligase [Stieleria neptunia]|uniref:O-Antigen ligase n=2 Tax=Stieleria neptunia TaxID=2527979 RepID=A0A518HTU0_9BACT|nr:O-Antigen ligase [Stieleria neptunia]